jgi:hypothetical protein
MDSGGDVAPLAERVFSFPGAIAMNLVHVSNLMPRCRWMVPLLAVLGWGMTVAGPVQGEPPRGEQASPKPESKNEIELFDGKSLKNWKVTDFGGQGEVSVKQGQLIMGAGEPLTGVTWKGPDLPKVNYEITFEAQRVDGNDFFCGLTFPVKDDPCTLVLGGWGGGVIGLSSIDGFDASENETTDYYSFDSGKWYPVKIRVTDQRIQAWLDEKQIADVEYSDRQVSIRIEMELCRPLGLCTFQTTGAIRNLKLHKLATENKEPESQ